MVGSEIRDQRQQLRLVGSWNPIIYKVLAPSKRWLGIGFLNHQKYPPKKKKTNINMTIKHPTMNESMWCISLLNAWWIFNRNRHGVSWTPGVGVCFPKFSGRKVGANPSRFVTNGVVHGALFLAPKKVGWEITPEGKITRWWQLKYVYVHL